ncbi:MAG: hypothetical protein Q9O62_04810 [Ardenticatenia bacterium]|nr:hypothetical protein [Ardenticatenia bacterium]
MEHPNNKGRWPWPTAVLVVLLTLPALWPLARPGYWRSDDGLIHLFRLMALRQAVEAGNWYPRLFPEFAFEYGFAVFHYYAPLTYYVGLLLTWAGAGDIAAMKGAFGLSLVASALAMWWLARDVWADEAAGLMAALIYTYLPYHLADVYRRGALAESWAFVWWPLVMWGVWRGRRVPVVVGLAALVLTHNLSALLFAPVLAVWWGTVVWARRPPGAPLWPHVWDFGRRVIADVALAALLSAFYWLPVLLETTWVLLAGDVGGQGFLRHLYPWSELISRTFVYQYVPEQAVAAEHPLSWVHLALLLMLVPVWWWHRRRRGRWPSAPLVALLAGLLFLLTDMSKPVWTLIAVPFGMIQYPWRWLGPIVLLTALLSGPAVMLAHGRRARAGVVLGALVVLAGSSLPRLSTETMTVEVGRYPEAMWAEDFRLRQIGATWTAEYLPRWVREERWAVPLPVQRPEVGGGLPAERVRLVRATPWWYELDVELRAPAPLRLHQFYVPAWQAWIDGQPVSTWPSTSLGLVTTAVPPGRHRVTFAWRATRPVAVGIGLTAVGVGLVLVGVARRWPGVGSRRVWRAGVVGTLMITVVMAAGRVHPSPKPERFTPAGAAVGDLAWLVGWRQVPVAPKSGQSLSITLYWLSRRPTPMNYKVFVHLTGPDGGRPLAQSDGDPGGGYTPTSRWVAGELVPDRHRLDVPDDLPPGDYLLWAGLYDFSTGERLPVEGRQDGRVFLGTVVIRPSE